MEGIISFPDNLSDVMHPQKYLREKKCHFETVKSNLHCTHDVCDEMYCCHTCLLLLRACCLKFFPIRWVNIWIAAKTHQCKHHHHQTQTPLWFYSMKHLISSVPELMTPGSHFSPPKFSSLIQQTSSGLNISFLSPISDHFYISHNYN